MEAVFLKAKFCYEQDIGHIDLRKAWKGKRQENMIRRKKGFKPPLYRNQPRFTHQDLHHKVV